MSYIMLWPTKGFFALISISITKENPISFWNSSSSSASLLFCWVYDWEEVSIWLSKDAVVSWDEKIRDWVFWEDWVLVDWEALVDYKERTWSCCYLADFSLSSGLDCFFSSSSLFWVFWSCLTLWVVLFLFFHFLTRKMSEFFLYSVKKVLRWWYLL